MTTIAPSCPINHSQPTSRPRQPPPADVTHIPKANDLRSAINSLNLLGQALRNITRTPPQINNVYPTTVIGVPDPTGQGATPVYRQVSWQETSRNYSTQKVINPDDKDEVIEIKIISDIAWTDSTSGHSIRYQGQV